jgi:hypothetical protein
MARSKPCRGRAAWWLLPALAALALLTWWRPDAAREQLAAPRQEARADAAIVAAPVSSAGPASGALVAQPTPAARQHELALWQRRLETAQQTLQAYREATRYPPEARLLSEQRDQARPNLPVVEDLPLRLADGSAARGVRVRTSQERVFVQGEESVRLSVSLRADDGTALPLRIVRASAREIPPPNTGSLYPVVSVNFNDEGVDGEVRALDGVYGVRLQPQQLGFAGLSGALRVEVMLEHATRQASVYFDLVLTGMPPAVWTGAVREALEDGTLNFYLGVEVKEPGQYVVSARVDDARGRPVALLTHNDEVAAGAQELRLSLFGRLVRDVKPVFPLTLRDVEAFLLRPDAFPDRSLMERRPGSLHVSARHSLDAFSTAEWQGEERGRYLAQMQQDVDEAQTKVTQLEARR